MHELAIAEGILGVALEEAGGRPVRKVHVVVGHLRQVVPSALTLSFELVSAGTPAEGAELELEQVPAAGRCRECGIESVMKAFPLTCNCCGGVDMEVVRGRELRVEWLEVEEEEPESTGGTSSEASERAAMGEAPEGGSGGRSRPGNRTRGSENNGG